MTDLEIIEAYCETRNMNLTSSIAHYHTNWYGAYVSGASMVFCVAGGEVVEAYHDC